MSLQTHPGTGWDCHAHLFGPYARFPLVADRSYTPPEAVLAQYLTLLKRLDLGNGVLVQPSAYGSDHSLLLDALASHSALRGVVVVHPDTPLSLPSLQSSGVRAARFSQRSGAGANFAGSASFDDLCTLAPRLADSGLHAELWTDCATLPSMAERILALPVPVVIDHMGGFDIAAGTDEPGFCTLLSLLATGKVWVKLCAYRNLLKTTDWELGQPFHQKLVDTNPERLIWGSDWPHLRVDPAPDAVQLLALFQSWTKDKAVAEQILQTNPERLYR